MNERFRALVYGTVFAVVVGWVLYIARDILVPIVFSVLVLYVIIGSARFMARLPVIGPALPVHVHYGLSTLAILIALMLLAWLTMNSVDTLIAQAPHYQAQLVGLVQRGGRLFGVESDPSWETIRQYVLAQVNLQTVATSALRWLVAILASLSVVALYVVFLMIERGNVDSKLARLSPDPEQNARIRRVMADINGRIGAYLALKTLLSVLLGLATWAILVFFGVELPVFWALVVGLLNYVPYIGSVLGVAFPALFALLQFGDLRSILGVTAALGIVQFLNGNLLDPFLMGNSLNLSPFVILVSLTVWSALWGIPGAFLAVPITACMMMVLAQFSGSRPLAVMLSQKGEV